jgi:hypothetical protein
MFNKIGFRILTEIIMHETHNLCLIFNSNRAAMLLLHLKSIFIIVMGKIQYETYSGFQDWTFKFELKYNFKLDWYIDMNPTGACRRTLEVFLGWFLHQSPVDNEKSPLWESHAKIWGCWVSTFWCGITCLPRLKFCKETESDVKNVIISEKFII